mmetsp:Transcript_31185/g.67513  ORF Transcript_31185/g.67513 Transcript_31185/m.67513 type:complete len:559 (-) Transcript_31185:321-1997(-)
MATATAEGDKAAEAALLARLQAQFGDIDLSNLTSAAAGNARDTGNGDGNGSDIMPTDSTGKGVDGEEVEGEGDYCYQEEEDESSVEEPTAEELLAWQQAQYKLAQWGREASDARKKSEADAEAAGAAAGEDNDDMTAEEQLQEWVRIEGPPDLDGQDSAFFLGVGSSKKSETRIEEEISTTTATTKTTIGVVQTSAASSPTIELRDTPSDLDPILAQLSVAEPNLGGKWKRLYSSNQDGLSYARFVSSLRGYDGPTLLLLGAVPPSNGGVGASTTAKAAATIGYYTSTPWKESCRYYGSSSCFLFRVEEGSDVVHTYRPLPPPRSSSTRASGTSLSIGASLSADFSEAESMEEEVAAAKAAAAAAAASISAQPTKSQDKYQFCHSTIAAAIVSDGRKPGQHPDDNIGKGAQVPSGLGVGGQGRGSSAGGPRLHITETLENCTALPHDGTFQPGPLLPPFFGEGCISSPVPHTFDVDVMEAWGVGGSERIRSALKARDTQRMYKEAHRKKNAEVDRAQFLDHFRSDMVNCKVFTHAHHTTGRVDDCELESDGSMLSHLS